MDEKQSSDNSFDRDDEEIPEILPTLAEVRKSKSESKGNKNDNNLNKTNELILNHIDQSIKIDFQKPKDIDEKDSDSHLSLIESSGPDDLKFFNSDQESPEHPCQNYTESNEKDGSSKETPEKASDSKDDKISKSPTKDAEKIKEKSKNDEEEAKIAKYRPIKKGKFVRKKDLENTIGKGDTLGGLNTTEIQVLQFLGSGGEGKVYLGLLTELNQLVAFKQFEIVENKEQEDKIKIAISKEMKLVKKLSHENLVKFFTIHKSNLDGDNAVQYNILMEYWEGGSLDQKLHKNKGHALKLPAAKSIIYQVLKGLEYLHRNNVIHRDLKPGNILMNEEHKHFKIADFGVATKVIGENSNTKRTETGTAWYMAPEVIKNEKYSYPIDIWAVGCILYELLSGKRPYYTSKNKFASMFSTANNQTPLEKSDDKIRKKFKDKALRDFLDKCWHAEPGKRAKASELLEHEFLQNHEEYLI